MEKAGNRTQSRKTSRVRRSESAPKSTPPKPAPRAPDSPGRTRRSDEGRAFLPDPYDITRPHARTSEPLAEKLAEDFLSAATSAEEQTEDDRNELRTDEVGGPFTETSAAEEFATEPDESNPPDAAREPFPTATHPRAK